MVGCSSYHWSYNIVDKINFLLVPHPHAIVAILDTSTSVDILVSVCSHVRLPLSH